MKCKTCGMERGEHDRACVQEQLHSQKLAIIKKLARLKGRSSDFPTRLFNAGVDRAIKTVQEA